MVSMDKDLEQKRTNPSNLTMAEAATSKNTCAIWYHSGRINRLLQMSMLFRQPMAECVEAAFMLGASLFTRQGILTVFERR